MARAAAPEKGPIEALGEEIARWTRIRRPEGPAAPAALQSAFADATASWVELWPGEELAWRERLRALEGAAAGHGQIEAALEGAGRTLGRREGLRFPEDTRFLMARAAVRHGVRLADVEGWLRAALRSVEKELPAGEHPLVAAYRRERLSQARWRAARIRAELAFRAGDDERLARRIVALTAESGVTVADPADRIAAAERARRRAAVFVWRARLATMRGAHGEAARRYTQALAARPTQPGDPEPPENALLLEEAARHGAPEAGAGTAIPPAASASPHWLPTEQRLAGFVPDGRPAVAAVWDGEDPRIARGIERLRRTDEVGVLSLTGASPDWVAAVNPLYAAAQLWIVDPGGVIRLVGRLQPGVDGWEDAITGAAVRSSAGRR
jgi:hypothetical protein